MAIESELQFDEEKEEEMIRKSKSTRPFEQTVSVKIDAKTGTIVGWDSLFRLIEAEEAAKLKNKSAQDVWSAVGGKLLQKIRPGDYKIIPVGVNNDKFILEHRDGTKVEINIQVNDDGSVDYVGLPDEFTYLLNSFSDKEKTQEPLLILQSIIKTKEGKNQP